MLWCFVKGFGFTAVGAAALALFIWAHVRLGRFLIRRFDWDEDNVIGGFFFGWGFIVVGTIISLGVCGIIK